MIAGQNSVSPLHTNSGYSQVFLMLGLFAMGSSLVLFILTPKLRKLLQEKKPVELQDSKAMATNQVVLCE